MPGYYSQYLDIIHDALARTIVTDRSGETIDIDGALTLLRERLAAVRAKNGFLYFCGNGASAGMASHFSVDWLKNAGIRSAVFTDAATLTAYGNDTGYDNVFAGPIARVGTKNDAVVTISSSGASPNIVKALEAARAAGLFIITLSGFKADNPSRSAGDVNFYVPCDTYGVAECSHQIILHAWLDHFMAQEPRAQF